MTPCDCELRVSQFHTKSATSGNVCSPRTANSFRMTQMSVAMLREDSYEVVCIFTYIYYCFTYHSLFWRIVFVASLKHFCLTIRPCVFSALEIFLSMRYIHCVQKKTPTYIYIYISLFTIIMVAQKEKKLQPKAKNASNTQQT